MAEIAQLKRICSEGLAAVGYELLDLNFQRDPQGWVLRVYIDLPPEEGAEPPLAPAGVTSGGKRLPASRVTHDDCARASDQLGVVLDVEDPISQAYRLEVSSPGVRRPLVSAGDFRRFAGYLARIVTREPVEGRKKFCGLLGATDAEGVTIEVDGRPFRVPLGAVKRAHLELDP